VVILASNVAPTRQCGDCRQTFPRMPDYPQPGRFFLFSHSCDTDSCDSCDSSLRFRGECRKSRNCRCRNSPRIRNPITQGHVFNLPTVRG
jgi:hypothetical protein